MEVVSEKKNSELKKLNREEKHREVKIEEQVNYTNCLYDFNYVQ